MIGIFARTVRYFRASAESASLETDRGLIPGPNAGTPAGRSRNRQNTKGLSSESVTIAIRTYLLELIDQNRLARYGHHSFDSSPEPASCSYKGAKATLGRC